MANRFVEIDGARVEQTARPHVDSGLPPFWRGGGLQALARDGNWCDVPVCDDGIAVNFGQEPAAPPAISATAIDPIFLRTTRSLPIAGAAAFTPFLYGDHLWSLTTRFPDNFGLGPLRPPREPERAVS